jgi:D-alanyl-D-alanine carboxypeptidase (penicillin-binding protein 5/6)
MNEHRALGRGHQRRARPQWANVSHRGGYRGQSPPRGDRRWRGPALLAVLAAAGALVLETAAPPWPAELPTVSLAGIAWPAAGVSAGGIGGLGVVDGPGAHRPVPIASVAKVMTAYVVLHDHPLSAGEQGPVIVVRAAEAAAYPAQARNGDSLVPVTAGEQISERQALEALLLPSADNMAWILARWDAGSETAFLARMNATARRLGLTGTRYTDPSGLAASTVSTAADQVRLAMAAMRQPALAAIVAMPAAVIPVAGVVHNYNALLGHDGITGIKTGTTPAAGGCAVLAAWHHLRGRMTLVIAATFGQPGTAQTMLPNALQAGHQLVRALERALPHRAGKGHARPRGGDS